MSKRLPDSMSRRPACSRVLHEHPSSPLRAFGDRLEIAGYHRSAPRVVSTSGSPNAVKRSAVTSASGNAIAMKPTVANVLPASAARLTARTEEAQ